MGVFFFFWVGTRGEGYFGGGGVESLQFLCVFFLSFSFCLASICSEGRKQSTTYNVSTRLEGLVKLCNISSARIIGTFREM